MRNLVGGLKKKIMDSELDSDELRGTASGLSWWYESETT